MFDAFDDPTLLPSGLDLIHLEQLEVDGRVEAENGTWVVLRYPPMPLKGWRWCEYIMIVNCAFLSEHTKPYELKTLNGVRLMLGALEEERLKRRSSHQDW
jgi:hypothetical protein